MIRNLFVRFLLKFFPAMVALKCEECNRIVEPSNVDSHNTFYHPGRVLDERSQVNTKLIAEAQRAGK